MRKPINPNRVDTRDWVVLGLALVCVMFLWVVEEKPETEKIQPERTQVCVWKGEDVQCVLGGYWAVGTDGDLWVYMEVIDGEDIAVGAWKDGEWDRAVIEWGRVNYKVK